MLLCWISGMALVETPEFFSQDFESMSSESNIPTSGWITYGIDAERTGEAATIFGDVTSAYRLLRLSGMTIAMANTEFADSKDADEWLISPEIEIPYDNAALLFTACAFANNGNGMGVGMNNFKILLSESGASKDDFKELLIETGIRGSATVEVTTKHLVVPVNGMKGQCIRLAFVVTGSNVGLTGFTNLKMGQYILDATNYTEEVAQLGSTISIDVNVGLKTPVECGYLDAVLSLNGKEVGRKEYKKTFGSPTSYILQMQRITFDNVITLEDESPVAYTLTLTPRFEGAKKSSVSGFVATPGATYPANVVVEEMTATGCGYCPRGTAALEYYLNKYPGSKTQGRAIAIGIHGFMNYYDPMSQGVEDYLTDAQTLNGTTGLPAAIFNRASRGLDPTYIQEMEKQIQTRSYNSAEIKSVEINETTDGKIMEVGFEIRNGYNSESRPLNAAVVLIENDVQGYDRGYIQTNYFYNATAQQFTSLWSRELLPYIKPYLEGGELGYEMISSALMKYQHVARGIFPNFNGMTVAEEWEADKPRDFKISFQIPSNVNEINNTEAIILVIDPSNDTIVASDIISADAYNNSAVDSINNENETTIKGCEEGIIVVAQNETFVKVLTPTGIIVSSANMNPGETFIPVAGKGVFIVEVTDGRTLHRTLKIRL